MLEPGGFGKGLAQSVWSGLSWFPKSLEADSLDLRGLEGTNFTLPLPPDRKKARK